MNNNLYLGEKAEFAGYGRTDCLLGYGLHEFISIRRYIMVKVGLYVRLEAKSGRENDVASFLSGALPMVQAETGTTAWFALRMGPTTFGIFDAFADDGGRQAHLAGRVAAALMANAPKLLAQPPVIEKIDILASKLPG